MRQAEIADVLLIAEDVLGVNAEELRYQVNLPLAESALHAPFAGFGDVEIYPDPAAKAAVLCARIIANHPLPDGNKRVGRTLMRLLLDEQGLTWTTPPGGEDEEVAVLWQLAAGELTEDAFIAWVSERTTWT